MRRLILSTMAGLLALAVGSVASPGYAWDMAGVGGRSCAQFGQDYQRAPRMADAFYFSWAQGYMTAFDSFWEMAKHPPVDLLPQALPVQAQREFIRDWCAGHPLDQYNLAVLKLIETLRANPGGAAPRP